MTTEWNETSPPKDREFLAFAHVFGLEMSAPRRVVAEWHATTDSFRPTKLAGDRQTGAELMVLVWTELPNEPTV